MKANENVKLLYLLKLLPDFTLARNLLVKLSALIWNENLSVRDTKVIGYPLPPNTTRLKVFGS